MAGATTDHTQRNEQTEGNQETTAVGQVVSPRYAMRFFHRQFGEAGSELLKKVWRIADSHRNFHQGKVQITLFESENRIELSNPEVNFINSAFDLPTDKASLHQLFSLIASEVDGGTVVYGITDDDHRVIHAYLADELQSDETVSLTFGMGMRFKLSTQDSTGEGPDRGPFITEDDLNFDLPRIDRDT